MEVERQPVEEPDDEDWPADMEAQGDDVELPVPPAALQGVEVFSDDEDELDTSAEQHRAGAPREGAAALQWGRETRGRRMYCEGVPAQQVPFSVVSEHRVFCPAGGTRALRKHSATSRILFALYYESHRILCVFTALSLLPLFKLLCGRRRARHAGYPLAPPAVHQILLQVRSRTSAAFAGAPASESATMVAFVQL